MESSVGRREIKTEIIAVMHRVKKESQERYFPAWFAFPHSKICRFPEDYKTKEIATVIPGDVSTYVFDDEEAYLMDYAQSRFGWTWKKGGWDCMRHLEILACRCVPLFRGIEACPEASMVPYPKKLLKSIHDQWTKDPGVDEKTYAEWRKVLDAYFESALTCGAMVQLTYECVFGSLATKQPRKILFLDHRIPEKPDYLSMMVLIGLYEAWPAATIDVPFDVPYLYSDFPGPTSGLYGKGFCYAGAIHASLRAPWRPLDEALKDVESYDLVVYGSVKRSQPGIYVIQNRVPKERIWLFCGADRQPHISRLNQWPRLGTVFMREANTELLMS
jgi:hypothetical protein